VWKKMIQPLGNFVLRKGVLGNGTVPTESVARGFSCIELQCLLAGYTITPLFLHTSLIVVH